MRHAFLSLHRDLPAHDLHSDAHAVVQWHVFRNLIEADDFADHVMLGSGQRLVGGSARDSVGPLWWVGVEVEDVAHWGNHGAINKHAA